MIRFSILLLVQGIFLLLISCTEELSLIEKPQDSILCVNSLVSSGDSIKIYINNTVAITTQQYEQAQVENVELKIDGVNVDLVYNGSFYKASVKPKGGNALLLNVTDKFGKVITTIDTIPYKTKIISSNYTYPAFESSSQIVYGKLNFSFVDNINELNYYELFFVHKDNYRYMFIMKNEIADIDRDNDAFSPESILFSDNLFNGDTVMLDLYVSSIKPDIILRSCSKTYYEYKKSLYQHLYSQNTDRQNIYEFFKGDPIELYSNIEGGVGIFAAYAEEKHSVVRQNN